jgi:hypothetical protein
VNVRGRIGEWQDHDERLLGQPPALSEAAVPAVQYDQMLN